MRVLVSPHLKSQSSFDLILEHIGDRTVEVGENLHRQLWVDASVRDEIIEGVCQSSAEAIQSSVSQSVVGYSRERFGAMYLLRRYSS